MSASPVETRARRTLGRDGTLRCRTCGSCCAAVPAGARYCGDCGVATEATALYGRDGVVEHAWLEMLAALAGQPRATTGTAPGRVQSDAEIMWQLMNGDDDTAVWSASRADADAATRVDGVTWPRYAAASAEPAPVDTVPQWDRTCGYGEALACGALGEDALPRAREVEVEVEVDGASHGTVDITMPLAAPRAALVLRLAPTGFPGQGVPVDAQLVPRGGTLDLGRACDGPWHGDPYLDEWHARLTSDPEGLRVIDPGSQGGLWLRLDTPWWLRDGDQFRIGEQFLCFDEPPLAGTAGVRGRVQLLDAQARFGVAVPLSRACVLGRGGTDIVLLHDPFVSAEHCRLQPEGDGVRLEDLGSSNGTWLRMRSGDLLPFGAVVAIGRHLYRVVPAEP
ncbi:MAG: FHA domain-containing protein [Deltaproteobacteria bacterium]|nr:FHA domain-containing protein [Deltaproteobacteria bacterium]MBK8238452.1 FHA domain-containing protein [Deltaproteobacteria bacterium]MBK8717280.1 FHA domain-containing protein [Deltaproteobacteria bacterium]MBP7291945.1 FHA domain-containing protein [Nannocystaceae bacterium]